MAGWMLDCKEYATLISQSMDQSLSMTERFSLKLHQVLCPACKLIRQQFDTMRQACQFTPDDGASSSDREAGRLSEEVCERIKTVLRKIAKEGDKP